MILYGEEVAQKILDKVKEQKIEKMLVILSNPKDEASKVYIKNKLNACEYCNIPCAVIPMDTCYTEDYLKTIYNLNRNEKVGGIIVQLPVPEGVDKNMLMESIDPKKDVDGFGKKAKVAPCTPAGIMAMIKYYKGKDWLKGKNAVVIGRSEIVGKPMAKLLLDADATVTICHSKTSNLQQHTKNADLVVCAVGKPNFLKFSMVKPGATIIDVGINRVNGKLCGDCDPELSRLCYLSPVPGGVGKMTVASLMMNMAILNKEKTLEK